MHACNHPRTHTYAYFNTQYSDMSRVGLHTSRFDYCNAVLAGLPTSTLAPLQRVLNAAARFVAGAVSRKHVCGIMKSLH